MTKDEQLKAFYDILSDRYEILVKRYKQMCFLSHIDFSEDVMQDTVVKVAEKIKRDGISAQTAHEIESYFFRACKLNHLQEHLQESKRNIDDNVDMTELDLFDTDYSDDKYIKADFTKAYLSKLIKDNFSPLEYAIWRLRYLIEIDGKNLNYKSIKKITGVTNSRAILIKINKFIRENVTRDIINDEYKHNFQEYF